VREREREIEREREEERERERERELGRLVEVQRRVAVLQHGPQTIQVLAFLP